jgi:hypothetical protein
MNFNIVTNFHKSCNGDLMNFTCYRCCIKMFASEKKTISVRRVSESWNVSRLFPAHLESAINRKHGQVLSMNACTHCKYLSQKGTTENEELFLEFGGDVPREISNLSPAEGKYISLVRLSTCFFKAPRKKCSFPHVAHSAKLSNQESFDGLIGLLHSNANQANINVGNIRTALCWLRENNPLYSDVGNIWESLDTFVINSNISFSI